MEVLEHIPEKFESIVLDNIDRAAGRGVVLSWAALGQPGFHHVNNRSPTYVSETLSKRGFRIDQKASDVLRKVATYYWLKNNVRVYLRD